MPLKRQERNPGFQVRLWSQRGKVALNPIPACFAGLVLKLAEVSLALKEVSLALKEVSLALKARGED